MSSIKFNINANALIGSLNKTIPDLQKQVEKELDAFGLATVAQAKRLAPVDEGYLRNSIGYERNGLNAKVFATANYAAYVEFGTKGFAAKYVASLPADWQTYAATFKGRGGGSFSGLLDALMRWVKVKGLNPRDGQTIEQLAYTMALKILREGIKAQPFLYPAFVQQKSKLLANLAAK